MTPKTESPAPNVSFIDSEYVTPPALATMLRISLRTLMRWDSLRQGPPRTIIGRTVLYRRAAVQEWLREREQGAPRERRRRSA